MIHFSDLIFHISTVCDDSSTTINNFDVRPYVFLCQQSLKFFLLISLRRDEQRKMQRNFAKLNFINGCQTFSLDIQIGESGGNRAFHAFCIDFIQSLRWTADRPS